MSVQVTVALGDDGLVAVKAATTDDDIERLRAEAARIRHVGHPGVVSLVGLDDEPPGVRMRTRYAGDPLDTWSGTVAQAAGLAAAVAATLADLHEAGIVHGRLDESHVLVGPDGRPRLCGLAGLAGAGPADDVLAVGRLVEWLLDRARPDRRGPLPWQWGYSAHRRALAQVATRVLDPVPGRRPSARGLAGSILAAVPDAELPPGTALPSPGPAADADDGPLWPEPPRPLPWTVVAPTTPPRPLTTLLAGDAPAAATPPASSATDAPAGAAVWRHDGPTGPATSPSRDGDASTAAAADAPGGTDLWSTRHPSGTALPDDRFSSPIDAADGPATPSVSQGDRRSGSPADDVGGPGTASVWADVGGSSSTGSPLENRATPRSVREAASNGSSDGRSDARPVAPAHDLMLAVVPSDDGGRTGSGRAAAAGAGRGAGGDLAMRLARQPVATSGSWTAWSRWAVAAGLSVDVEAWMREVVPAAHRPQADRWPASGDRTPPRLVLVPGGHDDEPDDSIPDIGRARANRAAGRAEHPVVGLPAVQALGSAPEPPPATSDKFPQAMGGDPPPAEADDAVRLEGWRDRRARQPTPEAPRRIPGAAVAAAAGTLGVALVAGVLLAVAPADRPDTSGTEATSGPDPAAGCADVRPPAGDVDGDGCPEPLVVDGHTVASGDARWSLGEAGDVVAVGDWDCDGSSSPAVLRPATGDVFVFPGWAPADAPLTVPAVRTVPGGAALRPEPDADGCDALVVERADGDATVVEEARA